MRLFIMLILLNFFSFQGINAQKENPVKWTFELKKIKNSEYELIATATIKHGWMMYSQFTEDNGPVPTSFTIGDKEVKFEEKSKSSKEFDPLFEVNVVKFKEEAIFSFKFKKEDVHNCKGYVTFMTCDGEKCLPPTDVDFDLAYVN